MELNHDYLKELDPLLLSNTITISALVGLLIRKGVVSSEELTEEIRKLRSKVGETAAAGERSPGGGGTGGGGTGDQVG